MATPTKPTAEQLSKYTANIGIEVHLQLKTASKIFCSCPNQFGDQPNQNICPTCCGYPGVLPSLNKKVVDSAIKLGLATNSTITRTTDFARKHYMYPDLPKNFQITQDDKPICTNGYVPIDLPGGAEKKINLVRIHMEEDAGKNIHASGGVSYVDLNRAGTPLLEIVSQPDMENAAETRAYLGRLKAIVQYLNISDADMEKGSFRADTNISVRKKEDSKLGAKVELKNINSFKYIGQAIEYEIERQILALENGERIHQETRCWDEKEHKSIFMRSKESAQDYRYFREPDLPIVQIDDTWIDQMKKEIPELPHQKLVRFKSQYGLTYDEAVILSNDFELSAYFEKTVALCKNAKQVCNWMLRNLLAYLNENKLEISQSRITPALLAELVTEIERGTITSKIAQEVFEEMVTSGATPITIINKKGLKQINSAAELEPIILEIIAKNPEQVATYKGGNQRLFAFFVGQTMAATQGKANPQMIKELLEKHLK